MWNWHERDRENDLDTALQRTWIMDSALLCILSLAAVDGGDDE